MRDWPDLGLLRPSSPNQIVASMPRSGARILRTAVGYIPPALGGLEFRTVSRRELRVRTVVRRSLIYGIRKLDGRLEPTVIRFIDRPPISIKVVGCQKENKHCCHVVRKQKMHNDSHTWVQAIGFPENARHPDEYWLSLSQSQTCSRAPENEAI
jgi:hypothetical protein